MELALEYGNVSVTEIAAELGVSRTTISNYLHGRTPARRSDLVVWALRCGVPLDWLLDGSTEPEKSTEPEPAKASKPSKRARTQGNQHSRWNVDKAAPLHNVKRGTA